MRSRSGLRWADEAFPESRIIEKGFGAWVQGVRAGMMLLKVVRVSLMDRNWIRYDRVVSVAKIG